MKSVLMLLILSLGSFTLSGCAGKALENNLAAKLAEEPTVTGTLELQSDAGYYIENSKLSNPQKIQLRALQAHTVEQQRALRSESLKLRSILIQDVFSTNYNKNEVILIQDKIEKIEHKRLALTFETLDKANGILGRETNAQENQRLMHQMMLNRESL